MADPTFLPQPQRGVLCIGGPLDGQWLAEDQPPPRDYRLLQANVPGPLAVVPPAVDVVDVVYQRTRINLAGRSADVFLIKGFDPGDVLVRLLEGYRGRQSA